MGVGNLNRFKAISFNKKTGKIKNFTVSVQGKGAEAYKRAYKAAIKEAGNRYHVRRVINV